MIKKILLIFVCMLFLANSSLCFADDKVSTLLKPLKIEQNTNSKYKYGTFEKTFKNPLNNDTEEEQADKQQRKVFSILDVLNNLIFILFIAFAAILLIAKINNVTLLELFQGKFKAANNKFKVLSVKQLHDNHVIYLIEINAKQMIVGVTNSKIDTITPLDKTYSEEEIPPEYIEKLFEDETDIFKGLED